MKGKQWGEVWAWGVEIIVRNKLGPVTHSFGGATERGVGETREIWKKSRGVVATSSICWMVCTNNEVVAGGAKEKKNACGWVGCEVGRG